MCSDGYMLFSIELPNFALYFGWHFFSKKMLCLETCLSDRFLAGLTIRSVVSKKFSWWDWETSWGKVARSRRFCGNNSVVTLTLSTADGMGARRIFSRRSTRGFFLNFSRGGPKVVKFDFPPETKKTTFFCWKFQNPGETKTPLPPFRRQWPTGPFWMDRCKEILPNEIWRRKLVSCLIFESFGKASENSRNWSELPTVLIGWKFLLFYNIITKFLHTNKHAKLRCVTPSLTCIAG